jgi:hypothetical protein
MEIRHAIAMPPYPMIRNVLAAQADGRGKPEEAEESGDVSNSGDEHR